MVRESEWDGKKEQQQQKKKFKYLFRDAWGGISFAFPRSRVIDNLIYTADYIYQLTLFSIPAEEGGKEGGRDTGMTQNTNQLELQISSRRHRWMPKRFSRLRRASFELRAKEFLFIDPFQFSLHHFFRVLLRVVTSSLPLPWAKDLIWRKLRKLMEQTEHSWIRDAVDGDYEMEISGNAFSRLQVSK